VLGKEACPSLTDQLRTYLAWIIVVIWSSAAVVAFFTQNFAELGIVTPVMMIVVGFVFGFRSTVAPPPQDDRKEH
jgi:MFS-type transporter involved in bile tolerance (Atg22 family)